MLKYKRKVINEYFVYGVRSAFFSRIVFDISKQFGMDNDSIMLENDWAKIGEDWRAAIKKYSEQQEVLVGTK
jgi:hypothetical protein